MHRSHGKYPEERLKFTLLYDFAMLKLITLVYITIHKPHEFNDPLALLILNRTTGRYTPDSTVGLSTWQVHTQVAIMIQAQFAHQLIQQL